MAFECPRRSSPPSPMFDADTGCIATDPAPSARRRFRSKTGIENLPANEHAQETPHTPSPTRTTRRIQSGCAGSRPRLRDGMPGSPSQHIDITRAKWIPYSDFTYVSTWVGMIYVAFVIDVFARKIVGWRVSRSMTTEFVLDALNQAICQRCPMEADNLIHHSDRGSQYLAIRYAERLVEAGIDPSVGSVGDSYDNALAECIIGELYPKVTFCCVNSDTIIARPWHRAA